jgi:hypothetical protein
LVRKEPEIGGDLIESWFFSGSISQTCGGRLVLGPFENGLFMSFCLFHQ